MIGCLIIGHGDFGKGMLDSLEMIAGKQDYFKKLSFKENESLVNYEKNMKEIISELGKRTDGVVIFSDLLGGTPFKTAMLLTKSALNTAVITGSNLPMLVEVSILSQTETSADRLAKQAVEIGKSGMAYIKLEQLASEGREKKEEGI